MVADYHSYCAICGCTMGASEVGSESPDRLKRRRERVARIRKMREAERRDTYDDEYNEDDEEAVEPDEGEYCEENPKKKKTTPFLRQETRGRGEKVLLTV
jgi:hypothetical protein